MSHATIQVHVPQLLVVPVSLKVLLHLVIVRNIVVVLLHVKRDIKDVIVLVVARPNLVHV